MTTGHFTDDCIKCYHDMIKFPEDCPCGCHEHLRLLAKHEDCSIEEIARQIKEQQDKMNKDPVEYFLALFIHETGLDKILWKQVKEKVDKK